MRLPDGLVTEADCARCRFCCACRRESLWENVAIDDALYDRILKAWPNAPLHEARANGRATHMITFSYRTEDPEEEALCFFNREGCVLGDNKPFECAMWPLRVMNRNGKAVIACCMGCPVCAEMGLEKITQYVEKNRLDQIMFAWAESHPEVVKPLRGDYAVILEASE